MHHERVLTDGGGNPIHNALGEVLVFDCVKRCDATHRNIGLG
ncbi:hypothetical protein [Psychroserpens burtonensis]|nr:hypothetical protein [Psychroserpens burtonensis]